LSGGGGSGRRPTTATGGATLGVSDPLGGASLVAIRTSAAIFASVSDRMSSPSSDAVSAAFFSQRSASAESPCDHITPAVSSAHRTSSESSSFAPGNSMSEMPIPHG
jgi:hypothetical protein